MQTKISSFFKPSSAPKSPPIFYDDDDGDNEPTPFSDKEEPPIFGGGDEMVSFGRRNQRSSSPTSAELRIQIVETFGKESLTVEFDTTFLWIVKEKNETDGGLIAETMKKPIVVDSPLPSRTLNKKRNYAQFHLELGQSDFLLHSCSTCGLKYAPGDEGDEQVHKAFHKNFTHGIQFKVHEVVKIMEVEFGGGWIFHKNCVSIHFLPKGCWLSSCRTNTKAYKILSSSADERSDDTSSKEAGPNSNKLQFGTEAVPAICGIRAIWVTPSNRRKHIASQLLDAVRKSFCMGFVLKSSQLAFSQPTSAGMALASNYFGSVSFLVYRTDKSIC
ncbi:Protein chromosome transmission fidelity 7 [Vitis vinifera]|uniref:Protein chromosome transmission fidelity 7 n=1 Tax=Vitis vinifera TaxID=29760 RepID=A0A438E503_VITVI|nr:Protein chromosome transmission fidelity 7 [Vitis vinifera]